MTRNSRGYPPAWYVLNWLVPALFALLVSEVIRFHSLMPFPTMPRMVGNLLALDAAVLLGLLALGRLVKVPRDIAVLLLALAASFTISVLGSGDEDTSLVRLELYMAIALLAIAFYLLYRDAGRLPLEGHFLAVSVVYLPFLFSAVEWIGLLTPPYWQDGPRVADFLNVRQFGEFSFFAAASATAMGVLSRRLAWASILLAATALFGIILTGCRGALLSWILLAVALCCVSPGRLRIGLLGLVPLLVSGFLVWYLDQSGILHSPNVFGRIASTVTDQGPHVEGGRIEIWTGSLQQIFSRPFFGSGPEGYWLSGCCVRAFLQAHNFVLQFLMEFGVIGCGIAVLILYRTVRRLGGFANALSLAGATPGNRVLACMIVAYLAYSLIDQTMYHLLPLLLIAPVIGLFAAGLAQARTEVIASGR
jgi:O-antigen ligase